MWRAAWVIGACAVAMAWLAGAASAVAPVSGGLYRGQTSEHARISLHVAADGRSVKIDFRVIIDCPHHGYTTAVLFNRMRPKIKNGRFTFVEVDRDLPRSGIFPAIRVEDQHINGVFTAGGRAVHGTYHAATRLANGQRCTSAASYTASA